LRGRRNRRARIGRCRSGSWRFCTGKGERRGAGVGELEGMAGEGRRLEARMASTVAASRAKSAAPRESRAGSSTVSRSHCTARSSALEVAQSASFSPMVDRFPKLKLSVPPQIARRGWQQWMPQLRSLAAVRGRRAGDRSASRTVGASLLPLRLSSANLRTGPSLPREIGPIKQPSLLLRAP
jgi:hypothetical protein